MQPERCAYTRNSVKVPVTKLITFGAAPGRHRVKHHRAPHGLDPPDQVAQAAAVALQDVHAVVGPQFALHQVDVGTDRQLGLDGTVDIAAADAFDREAPGWGGVVAGEYLDRVAPRRERLIRAWGIRVRHGSLR
jgi:hypothetical protein